MIELTEAYADEMAQLSPTVPILDIESGAFEGALTAPFIGAKHGFDVAASALANAAMPILEKVTPESMTQWLDEERAIANQSMKETRTDPRTMGTVGQLLHGVSSVIAMGAMGAGLGPVGAAGAIGGLSGYGKATELIEQGVDMPTARAVGGVTGTVMAVGAALPPFIGGTLASQIASGIGINVGLGMAERAGTAEILDDRYADIAAHYKAIDGTAIAIDAVLGAAFPLGARLLRRPTVAQVDDAQAANRIVVEQSRDPALQATLEGIDRQRMAADDVSRQLLEENRPLGAIEIPPNVMDDVVPNRQFGEVASLAAKSIDDMMMQEGSLSMKAVEEDIAMLAKAFSKGEVDAVQVRVAKEVDVREQAADGKTVAEGDATKEPAAARAAEEEIRPDRFTQEVARSHAAADPAMMVVNEENQRVSAKELLDQAHARFEQEARETSLYKVAVACAIGVGE